MNGSMLAAGCLGTLAVLHSVLGERMALVPQLTPGRTSDLPRKVVDRILRFAWHLTSLAWLGLAAVVAGVDAAVAVGSVCLLSSLIVFAASRAHPAWPLFLIGGLAVLDHGGLLPSWSRPAAGGAAIAGLLAASALHGYWVLGGRWMRDRAVPSRPTPTSLHAVKSTSPNPDDRVETVLRPGSFETSAVAVALLVMAATIGAATVGVGGAVVLTVGWVGVGLFALRVVGDGRFVGFTKSIRTTPFARADDRIFTPFIVLLALGAAGGLLSVV